MRQCTIFPRDIALNAAEILDVHPNVLIGREW
jgi:hypothetical protein